MIISRTPYRISLFGGSTDYIDYYSQYGSFLIGMAINKYSYLSARRTPQILPYKFRFAYSQTEVLNDLDLDQIQHNAIRGVLKYLNWKSPIELSHFCDIPSQTGLGSSSSFTVGLINIIQKLNGKTSLKSELARYAIDVERRVLNEPGGIQDQIWAAYGGFNSISISENGEFKVKPLPISDDFVHNFTYNSALIYTGSQRDSFDLANHKQSLISDKREIHNISKEVYNHFVNEDLHSIGRFLDESWNFKKRLNTGITNNKVDEIYTVLKEHGMIGGKLLGAGGSGFIFALFDKPVSLIKFELPNDIRDSIITYNIDYSGSKIIYA